MQVSIERDGLRYEFDAVTGTELLLTLPGRVDVTATRPADALRLRRLLERQLRVDSLDRLHAEHAADLAELRRLGYL